MLKDERVCKCQKDSCPLERLMKLSFYVNTHNAHLATEYCHISSI